MRINPGVRVVAGRRGSVRLGSGPGSLAWRDLSAAQVHELRLLSAGEPLPDPAPEDVPERERLLRRLRPVLVEDDDGGALPGLAAERLRADGHAWSAALGGRAHELSGRLRRQVWVSGLDRCGLAVAFALAAAGVGRLSLPDDGRVGPGDLGSSPLRLTELGLPRAVAVARHVSRLYPHTHVLSPVGLAEAARGADLLIVVARDGLSPEAATRLRFARVPALPIVFHEAGFRVGPLTLPTAEGCHSCRAEGWAVLEDGDEVMGEASAPETTSALLAAALAAQAAVMVLDGLFTPSLVHGAYVGSLASASLHFEAVETDCVHRPAA